MKKQSNIIFIILFLLTTISFAQTLDLMPYPKELKLNEGKFRITKDFTVGIKGNGDERIFEAATSMLARLDARTGLFFQQGIINNENNSETGSLIITCERPGKIKLGENESYELIVSNDRAIINAPNDLGAMHALETLLQLLNADEEGYFFPSVEIKDEPRFPWRGLMLDVCRHFMPIDVIKRNIDAMAAVKLNVLHMHLSEDQGFRVESKVFPKLHEMGSDGLYFTQDQIKDIIQYAGKKGIRVYPEFDIPGHATSWFVGYPEYASAPGPYKIERNWGVFDPTFDPTNPETYKFFATLFTEMAGLFPDEYFHIGGDENNGKQWDTNETIQKFMKKKGIKDNHQLQAYFNTNILKILTKLNKKMIGWDEILHEEMPKDIVIQSWRGKESMIKAAKEGYRSILSNGYYIDLVQHTTDHYLNDPLPADIELNEEEKKNILGGEATMWAELITPETIDSRIWPRTASIAERFWSPGEVKAVDDMFRRLDRISFLLEEHGLLHIKNYDMMLRRLTNNNDITALKTLVNILEPVKFYQRHGQGVKYTQQSPYTRVVDAARPDSKTGREFEATVDKYLETKNAAVLEKLKTQLNIWKDNHEKLLNLISVSPVLKEIEPSSLNVSNLAAISIEALNLLRDGNKAPAPWLDKANSFIEDAKKPCAQTEIRIVKAVEKLKNAVSN